MSAPTPRHRWIWWLVWLAIAVVLAGRATGRKPTKGVLLDHLEFGRRLVHGEDVYGPWRSDPDAPIRPLHAPYPPSFGLLTAPFHLVDAALGQRAARFAWALLQLGSLVACALLLRRLVTPRAPPLAHDARWQWLWLGTFVLAARFVLRDTHGGGGNLINVALVLAAFAASERQQHGRAGAWLAFSLVTKPTMVWFLPVLWLLGRRRTVAHTLAFAALFALVTLVLQRFDLAPWWRWLQGSWLLAVQSDPWAVPAFEFPPFEWMNQALRFGIARWCGDVPSEFAAKVPWGVLPGLGLGGDAVAWLVRGSSVALVAGLAITAWRGRHAPRARLWLIAATFVLTLLLSPLSWKGHHVALLPVVLLLLERAVATRSRAVIAALAGWWLCCSLPGGDLVGDAMDEWLNSVYVVTLWDVALLLMALRLANSAAREHRDAAPVGELAQ